MPIDFHCTCGQSVSVPDAASGTHITCPSCKGTIAVPAADLFPTIAAPVAAAPIAAPAQPQSFAQRSGFPISRDPRPIPSSPPAPVEMLRQTIIWVRIMSILVFLGAAFPTFRRHYHVDWCILSAHERSDYLAPRDCLYSRFPLLYCSRPLLVALCNALQSLRSTPPRKQPRSRPSIPEILLEIHRNRRRVCFIIIYIVIIAIAIIVAIVTHR